jgi:hypothetical protein
VGRTYYDKYEKEKNTKQDKKTYNEDYISPHYGYGGCCGGYACGEFRDNSSSEYRFSI